MQLDTALIRAQARGQWRRLLFELAPVLEMALARIGRHVPCPVHGGHDGFRLFRDLDERGGGVCNTCGLFPDGFALLMWLTGWRFPRVLDVVARQLGLMDGGTGSGLRPVPSTPAVTTAPRASRALFLALWSETCAPFDPLAWPLRRYLEERGLEARLGGLDPHVVRFHPHLAYYESGRCRGYFPAMLARVSGINGRGLTLHRTYLAPDGGGKAPVRHPRKLMTPLAPLAGGAIRLAPLRTELGLAEGIETALAAQCVSGQPVWAAVSATLLERFEPPDGLRRLTIWADRDRSRAGELAALALRDRLEAVGIATAVRLPESAITRDRKSVDWADIVQSLRLQQPAV